MTVKELKEYLENFDEKSLVTVSMWDGRARYFMPHKPCCDPITFKAAGAKIAVIGVFDNCRAHEVTRK